MPSRPFPKLSSTCVASTRRMSLTANLALRRSSQVAQVGQRLTVEVAAANTSKRPGHGIVMLNYPEHLVSFMALYAPGQETLVQLPAAPTGLPASAAPATTACQLLW